MRLAKLTLAGFKSFADPTEFTFDEAITAIVGPNGCGKSNVVDAVKWVLGERSSKSLRGSEMLDVIFAGSAGRKPAGMASVTLTFDNPLIERPVADDVEARIRAVLDEPAGGEVVAAPAAPTAPATAPEGVEPTPQPPSGGGSGPGDADEPASILDQSVKARRALPIDTDQVSIERRLYRDGGSEYLINNKKARLKDIRDLFLDTGVGADAYCIIEQGKVDAMLLASPMERRSIFEEAAGIAKFRVRKAEASRKLERTEQNLAVTREQLDSTARRLKMVKGQAARARLFRQLDEERRALRLALWVEQYHDLIERLKGLTSRLAELEQERQKAAAGVGELEAAKQDAELRRHERADEQRQLEAALQAASHQEQSARQRGESAQKQVESLRASLASDQEQLAHTEQRVQNLHMQHEHLGEEVAKLGEQQAEAECALATLARSKAHLGERAGDLRSHAGAKRQAAAQVDRERAALLSALERDQKRAAAVSEQIASLAAKATSNHADAQSAAQRREALEAQIGQRTSEVEVLQARLADLTAGSQRLEGSRREAAERLAQLQQSHARLESRRHTLDELARSRAGLGDAVRHVLMQREKGQGFTGLVGVLADLIQVEQQDAPAVEAALGTLLQALVVPSLAQLPSAAELAALPGRAAFVPLAGVGSMNAPGGAASGESDAGEGAATVGTGVPAASPTRSEVDLADVPGVRSLRTLVRERAWAGHALNGSVAGLLDRVLARTFLAPDLDAALLLAAGPLAPLAHAGGLRLVTPGGAVLETDAGGRVTVGPSGKSEDGGGVLVRQSELDALGVQIAASSAQVAAQREALEALDAEAAALARELSGVRGAIEQQRSALAGDRSRLEQITHDQGRLERERVSLSAELDDLRARAAQLERERVELAAKAEKLHALHADQLDAAARLDAQAASVQCEVDALVEKITSAKVNAGRLAEQLSAARRERQQLEWQLEESTRRVASLQNSVKSRQAAMVEQNQIAADARTQGEAARTRGEALHKQVIAAAHEVSQAVSEAHALGERLGAAREQARLVERDWHSIEVAKREGEIKRESMEDRLQSDTGCDPAIIYGEYLEMLWTPAVQLRALMADPEAAQVGRLVEVYEAGEADAQGATPAHDAVGVSSETSSGAREDADLAPLAPLNHDDAAARLDDLTTEIKRLGNVNLDAIDEESQLAGRNESLAAQVADLDAAHADLTALIEQLNTASRERFRVAFETIKEHFAGEMGMFRKLFGGGKAELRLMPLVKDGVETEETDWLESGIEVVARPPGKQPHVISQLSGGEKAMTAVALLMSIFRSKPSCFCILDEVDAALDDANVERFAGVVRQFTSFSHFIVITHHKRTMHGADQLYGVTMQERGVSKRVQVKLEQIGPGGQIREGAAPPPATEKNADGALRRGLAGMREGAVVNR